MGPTSAGRGPMANDVHEILNGAKPGNIPYLSTDLIRIRDQSENDKGNGPHVPRTLLAAAEEVIE